MEASSAEIACIEVTQVGYAPLVKQDVRRRDVSVNNAVLMDVSKRPAQLAGCAEEVKERDLRTPGLEIPAVITESPAEAGTRTQGMD